MSINSTVSMDNQEDSATLYPRLMKSKTTGNIVIFTSLQAGCIAHLGENNNEFLTIGEYNDSYDTSYFEPLLKGESLTITQG